MRYKLSDQATTTPAKRGIPSESIYRIPARQSRQLRDRCGIRRVALAGDQARHLALHTIPSAPINDCPRTIVRLPKPQLPIKRFPWRLFQD